MSRHEHKPPQPGEAEALAAVLAALAPLTPEGQTRVLATAKEFYDGGRPTCRTRGT